MVCGKVLQRMLNHVKKNLKHVPAKDRDIIKTIDDTKIFLGQVGMKEVAVLLKSYRDLPKSK